MSEFVLSFRSLVLSYEIVTFRFQNLFSVFHNCYLVMKLTYSDYRFMLGLPILVIGYYVHDSRICTWFFITEHYYEIIVFRLNNLYLAFPFLRPLIHFQNISKFQNSNSRTPELIFYCFAVYVYVICLENNICLVCWFWVI